MKKVTTILALGLLALAPQVVEAQVGQGDNASIQATATVLAQLTVTGQDPLEFGQVLPGIPSTVAAGDPAAGRFLVSGAGSNTVQLSFDLPDELNGPEGAGLPISFASDAAGYGSASGTPSGTFDPNDNSHDQSLVDGDLYVFIGGTVTPATEQAQGSYTGSITLNVAYISN